MVPDAKWLDILKASGWQTGAIALACGIFLWFAETQLIPPLAPLAVQLVSFGGIVCGALAMGSLATEIFKVFPLHRMLARRIRIASEKRAVASYIPHMTPKEREIVGHLLASNQKMFTCTADGGHWTTLLSRGIVIRALKPGQTHLMSQMPVAVPDHVWEVLLAHKDEFPRPARRGGRYDQAP